MTIYNDDEAIAESSTQQELDSDSDSEPAAQEAGDTQLTYFNRTEASLKASNMKVLLELEASDRVEDRFPLDLVAVLDVSESMESKKKKKRTGKDEESKLLKLKRAMQFLIRKLSPTDRLSIVTFSTKSKRLFPLRLMTDQAQDESIEHVKEIKAIGRTNTAAGLTEGLKILSERRFTEERTAAIMLMSDGEQSPEFDEASEVDLIDQFPVYTFAFGKESTPEGLVEIAEKSAGGTYTDVKEEKNLSRAFALCLGGLLTVVVKDMNLTVKPTEGESEIEDVSAGKYYDEKKDNSTDNSKFISFGDLYSKEVRKILVFVRLLPRTEEMSVDVLETKYSYVSTSKKKKGKRFDAPPVKITVDRVEGATDEEIPKVIIEYKRAQTVDCVEEARKLADNGEFPAATRKMEEAKESLEEVKHLDDPEMIIKALLEEVEKLLKVMESPETYEEEGKSLIASFLSSQNLQRAVEGQLLYVTPLMLEYVRQAVEHDKDPSKPLPKPEDDLNADKSRREKQATERQEKEKETAKAKEKENETAKAKEKEKENETAAKEKEEAAKKKGAGFFGQFKADLEKKLNDLKRK